MNAYRCGLCKACVCLIGLLGLFSSERGVLLAQEASQSTKLGTLKTVAESSGFKATGRVADVTSFLKELVAIDPSLTLEPIGNSVEGRPIWSLHWNLPKEKSARSKRLVVLLLGGIHSGECDGKEALLALARDILAKVPAGYQDNLSLIFVPCYNVDGGERIGKEHRIGQVGPDEGSGVRENAQGLDLNRDFGKLESPEANALIHAIDQFDVDVLMDCHTTNGSLHRYDLTYSVPNNPASPRGLNSLLREQLLPTVGKSMKQKGYETFWYGNFDEKHERWETYGQEPRYSTDYMGLRGKIGILVESYSYSSYQRRIESSYWFVRDCLDYLASHRAEVQAQIEAAEKELVTKYDGSPLSSTFGIAPKRALPIQAKLTKQDAKVTALGYRLQPGDAETESTEPDSEEKKSARNELQHYLAGGDPSKLEKVDYEVELWTKFEPTTTVDLPYAYVIPRENAWAVDHLRRHGIVVSELLETTKLTVEQYTITKATPGAPFQGHRLWESIEVEPKRADASVPAGSFLIGVAQPLGRLASYLLEPHSDDSYAKWNFFDPNIRAGENFPVLRVLPVNLSIKYRHLDKIEGGETLTLEKLFSQDRRVSFGPMPAPGPRWLPGRAEYLVRRDNGTYVVSAQTGESHRYTDLDKLIAALDALDTFDETQARNAAQSANYSADRNVAMINFRDDLYLFDAAKNQARRVTNTPDAAEDLAELSPDGKFVAFVQNNNLFLVHGETGDVRGITNDGSSEKLNGILDWVYQEEIYGRGNFKAFWWSPDSQRVAYLQLEQTPVDRYEVNDSINYRQKLEETRYPKAGAALPTVRLFVSETASPGSKEIDLGAYPGDDRLVVRVGWKPDGKTLIFQIQNRIQTWLDLCSADPVTGSVATLFREQGPAWIDVIDVPRWLPSGEFLWLSDLPEGRRHLYRISADGKSRIALTSGDWDVSSIAYQSKDGTQVVIEGNEANPIESHLYRIDLANGNRQKITDQPGTHSADFDETGTYFFDRYTSVHQPSRMDLRTNAGELLRTISVPVSDRYKFLKIQQPQLLTIPAADGLPMQAMIIAPPNVDLKSPDKKYPVLFHVYGGPQAPTVANRFSDGNYWWHQYLAQQGYFVVLCDNRSAKGRGSKDTWTIHRNLGEVELKDLESAARWVGAQPWADANRLGIWGWSYGGYFTAFALTHSKLFKAGIAGAPVTDWRNYDAVYTERYMDTPQNNPEGYKKSSAVEAAENLSGRLLLIHGEIDDNVHMSNTLQLAYRLQRAGKEFELMIYPKNRHGVVDPAQRRHMHELMTKFLMENL